MVGGGVVGGGAVDLQSAPLNRYMDCRSPQFSYSGNYKT